MADIAFAVCTSHIQLYRGSSAHIKHGWLNAIVFQAGAGVIEGLIMEEFGVKVRVGEKITQAEFEHNEKKVQLHAYRIYVPHKGLFFKYKLTEHTEYKWVTFDEIKNLDFVDSDMLLYPEVRKYAESI